MSIDLYLVQLLVGNEGEPGAPLLHVSAAVDASTGQITGQAEITRAIEGPESDIRIHGLTGQIHSLGFKDALRVVWLKGRYEVPFPPPAIGSLTQQFSAVLVIGQDGWAGRGSFTFGHHEVPDVPVKSLQD
jgi:hypothetical protein